MDEFCICRFCERAGLLPLCADMNCHGGSDFKPDWTKILAKAKELGVSVVDIVDRINEEQRRKTKVVYERPDFKPTEGE